MILRVSPAIRAIACMILNCAMFEVRAFEVRFSAMLCTVEPVLIDRCIIYGDRDALIADANALIRWGFICPIRLQGECREMAIANERLQTLIAVESLNAGITKALALMQEARQALEYRSFIYRMNMEGGVCRQQMQGFEQTWSSSVGIRESTAIASNDAVYLHVRNA